MSDEPGEADETAETRDADGPREADEPHEPAHSGDTGRRDLTRRDLSRRDLSRRDLSRRDLLRHGAVGGVAVVGGGLLGHQLLPHGGSGPQSDADAAYQTTLATPAAASADDSGGHGGYGPGGHGYGVAPPADLAGDALDEVTLPPAFDGRQGVTREYELPVTERRLVVADGMVADAWTYAGTVPGPIIRATEGDTIRVRMDNQTGRPHNLHLHGRHTPAMDGWEPIPAGSSFTYEVVAGPVGLHPYHCHTAPLAEHIARGLYGAMIVDPPGGRPPAHEFVLTLGGWDLDGDGRIEVACWNGVAGFFHRHPIRVPVGERVRLYVTNLLEHEPVGSFHLHAQTFDVLRSGTSLEPDEHTDT
ncbi:MAG: multicopper oxidase domain-containing protein, partial [Actinomycetota bacterium]